ncbi:MAG: FkbM family methyltransferase [Acidobacteriota bacterium]|nr:FkbM family methyltransferase [Acidobacteriota bacterium]
MALRNQLIVWRTLAINRLLGRTRVLEWISAAKWAIYPLLVRWTPRVAIAIHEPESARVFWDAITPGMIVIDAGANRGGFSVLASRRVGANGRVFAFEPEARNFAILQKKMRRFPNVTPVQKAVSDAVGEAVLHLDSFHAGHSLVAVISGPAVSETRVAVTSLDAFAGDEKLPGIDLVKLDVEGSELQAIAGLREAMSGPRPPSLLVEVHAPNRPEDVIAAVTPYRYECRVLDAPLTGQAHQVPVHVFATPARRP